MPAPRRCSPPSTCSCIRDKSRYCRSRRLIQPRAYFVAAASASRRLAGPRGEIVLHQLGRQHDVGIVFRRILNLLEIVQAAILVDAVGAGDQPRRPRRIGVEVLMNRARRNVDDVARLPFEALDLGLRLPAIGVDDLDVAVLVQIIAVTLDHVEALFRQVPVLARPRPRRDHLHVGVDRLHARVHLFVQEMLEQSLPRHLPRHVLGMNDLLAPGVARRPRQRVVQQVLIEISVQRAAEPGPCFIPSHFLPLAAFASVPSQPPQSCGWLWSSSSCRGTKLPWVADGVFGRFSTVCWNSMFMNRYIGLVLMTKARAGSFALALKCWCTQLLCTMATSPAFQS